MTTVTAIIVNWNGAADTIACLESLQQVSRPGCDLSVVITDNASSDGSFAAIGQALTQRGYRAEPLAVPSDLSGRVSRGVRHVPGDDGPDITLVQTTDNLGFAGGNNVGVAMRAAAGRSDYFWFLNSDTLVDHAALSALLAKMAAEPAVGMCGSTLIHASDRKTVQSYGGSCYSLRTGRAWAPGDGCRYDPGVTDEWAERRINYVSGAAMFVRAAVLDAVGPMCEDYFLYNEEINWAVRTRGRFRLGVATNSIVYHKVGASIGTEGAAASASRLATFYQTRSKLLFAAKHGKRFYPTVWLTLLARAAKFMRVASRRAEAVVILQVLAGRRSVDPLWFAERRQQEQAPTPVKVVQ